MDQVLEEGYGIVANELRSNSGDLEAALDTARERLKHSHPEFDVDLLWDERWERIEHLVTLAFQGGMGGDASHSIGVLKLTLDSIWLVRITDFYELEIEVLAECSSHAEALERVPEVLPAILSLCTAPDGIRGLSNPEWREIVADWIDKDDQEVNFPWTWEQLAQVVLRFAEEALPHETGQQRQVLRDRYIEVASTATW